MTAPDPLTIRIYNNTVERHRMAAIQDATRIAEHAQVLAGRLVDGTGDYADADRIEQMACELARSVAALTALTEVADLITAPEGETTT